MTYWGLTQQDGPWKTTRQDKKNSAEKPKVARGGGVGVGGTVHAGNGNWVGVWVFTSEKFYFSVSAGWIKTTTKNE